jgi:hypothetical protein
VRATFAVRRRILGTVAAVAIATALTACGGGDVKVAVHDGPTKAAGPAGKVTDQPSEAADDAAAPTASKPPATLPPGDPGPDAPGTDDPNGDLGNEGGSDHPKHAAKTKVPHEAMLDVATVMAVAGKVGGWAASNPPPDSCFAPRPAKSVASLSSQLTGLNTAAPSQFVDTVSTHRGANAAVAAIAALEQRMLDCHATSAPDPRIGDASVQLTLPGPNNSTVVVTAAAVEGVTFVLAGSGPITDADTWSALTDIALGSTCAAAVDGCH